MRPNFEALSTRYQELRAVEDSKDKIIEDLLAGIKQLGFDFERARDDYDDQKRAAASLREDIKEHKHNINAMKRAQDKLSFVSVIVDGDGMNFLEDLVQGGKDGGDKAARLLLEASESHVQSTDPAAPSNTCYKIRVYANVSGLTKAYRTDKILDHDQDLTSFIQGFNKAHPLCDFVDVGDGKECSDVKMRAILERDLVDIHCQRVVFCASADNGYASVLRQYRGPKQGSDHISLVEGPPFARDMKDLAICFISWVRVHIAHVAMIITLRQAAGKSAIWCISRGRTLVSKDFPVETLHVFLAIVVPSGRVALTNTIVGSM
ncbi:hypothetical protein ASPVEDRAFT_154545 [Aspergillus versicolor CBS 583.65]|uniref:DUF7923 domain-containing protein n=1 Tax=Aspergillus versicolor CBS 583.65 TaxID=1036611 RepID=A0A1L9PYK6_ASPVE|nr:uncharacterized protein ASPVEDRAFT_154545 [Aspergillus versicolor CBS 583.65]OJJ06522.1 hypothetical protein ASPVEDRAFT_154545 [Aspergillus versicolor CBS 583.65]